MENGRADVSAIREQRDKLVEELMVEEQMVQEWTEWHEENYGGEEEVEEDPDMPELIPLEEAQAHQNPCRRSEQLYPQLLHHHRGEQTCS